MVRALLIATLVVAFAAAGFVSFGFHREWTNAHGLPPDCIRNYYLEAYKVIGIGFLIAMLGVVIPGHLEEARDRLARFKDSRVKYSQAKTSVMYLPETLAHLDDVGEAVAAVRLAHRRRHLAETYRKELREHLNWHRHPQTWIDRNYWELIAIRQVLRMNIGRWSKMKADERLSALREALKTVEDKFGQYNDNDRWWGDGWRKARRQKVHEYVRDLLFWWLWRATKDQEREIREALGID